MPPPRPWSPPRHPFLGRDLEAIGISARKLAGEVRRGTIVRLRQGVYLAAAAVPEDPRELHLVRALAEQVANPALVASHETAALAWRLPLPDDHSAADTPPSFLLPRCDHHRTTSGRNRRVTLAQLPAHHVTTGDRGLRLTTTARTAVDVAARLRLPEGLMVLDAAVRGECLAMPFVSQRRDLAKPRIREAGLAPLLNAATLHRSRSLKDALAIADPRHETPIESLSRGHMHLAGLPPPIPQPAVMTPVGRCYPDFLWPEHRVIGEADGRVKYRSADDMMREKSREQALRDLGFAIVRWTGHEICRTPAVVMDRITRALEAAL